LENRITNFIPVSYNKEAFERAKERVTADGLEEKPAEYNNRGDALDHNGLPKIDWAKHKSYVFS
jgi:hypothetical protein